MAVLGLILLAAAGVLTAAVVTSNTESLSVDLWGVSVTNLTTGVVFVAGMITTVLAVVGLGLLMGALRRNRRLRQERRTLRRENEQLAQRAEAAPADQPSTWHHDQPSTWHDGQHDGQHDSQPRPVHDDHTQVLGNDHARTGDSDPAHRHDPAAAPAAETTPGDGGSRRFRSRRDDRVPTDSGPRNS